jgi:tetratricopeptide (TPR) repeat protein
MGLFGKSKIEKLTEQIWDTPDSDPVKQLELHNEIIPLLLSQNKDENYFHLGDYYSDKSKILYRLRRYAESLESWEKSNEYYSWDEILPSSADEIVLKSKLLNKLGKYAEALNCINLLEKHLAKYGDMGYEEIHNNTRRKFDILDTINMEIPELKIYSMYKCGSPKSEIISYLQYLHDKINFTERDGCNHQKQIAILITKVNKWEFKPGLVIPKEATPPKDEIPNTDDPPNILKLKLAKGEITIEEYNKIKGILE